MVCRQPSQRPWSPRQLVVRDILDRSPSMQVLPPRILAHAHLRKKRSIGWQTIESECSTQLYCTSSSRRQSSSLLCLALTILHVVIVVVDDVDGEAKRDRLSVLHVQTRRVKLKHTYRDAYQHLLRHPNRHQLSQRLICDTCPTASCGPDCIRRRKTRAPHLEGRSILRRK